MHELSLAHGIFDLVQDHVPWERGAEVETVCVRVGELAGVVPESLRFCFEAIVGGTPYAGARLVIEPVSPVYRCRDCGHEFSAPTAVFGCAGCGGAAVRLIRGHELQVAHLDVTEPRDVTP